MIQRRATGDGEQPVDDGALAVDPTDVLERLHERVLRQVLGVLPVPGHLVDKVQDAAVMEADQIFEGTRVTA